MNPDNLLNFPHSRFVASTNYSQHYEKQCENEILSREKELFNFFKKYREVKEDCRTFNELRGFLQNNQNLENYSILKELYQPNAFDKFNLNEGIERLMTGREAHGKISESNDFLENTLGECENYVNEFQKQISQKSKNKYKLINIKKCKNEYSDEIEATLKEGNEILDSIFEMSETNQQELLNQIDFQILESTKEQNSELSLY